MSYPETIDTFRRVENGDNLLKEDQNEMAAAVEAIENTLGTDPQGAAESVKERLDAVDILTAPCTKIWKDEAGNAGMVVSGGNSIILTAQEGQILLQSKQLYLEPAFIVEEVEIDVETAISSRVNDVTDTTGLHTQIINIDRRGNVHFALDGQPLISILETGTIELRQNGHGISFKSPDGLITKTLTIDNNGDPVWS